LYADVCCEALVDTSAMVGRQTVDAQFDTTANSHVGMAVDEMGMAVDDQMGVVLNA
jgi:hypothetical protein